MRPKWLVKMSAIIIIALAIIFLAYDKLGVFKMASAEEKVVEKKEEPTLKGFGEKFFEVLDQEVENTKEFQKDNWLKVKDQFKKLFGIEDKEWNEVDEEMEKKE
jgi:predicted membrane protein